MLRSKVERRALFKRREARAPGARGQSDRVREEARSPQPNFVGYAAECETPPRRKERGR